MTYLLDTHTLIWWWTNDARLSPTAREVIANPDHAVAVSSASAWEISTKQRLGKLGLDDEIVDNFSGLVSTSEFMHVPITLEHALRAGGYKTDHRDPFDRMLAAQAELESMVLVSLDPAFAEFPVESVW